ncbi:MAG: DUF4058 family protein [Chitinophagaceae bacterium]|nr:DUF4058 family protein [Anaerolineae bacterium]
MPIGSHKNLYPGINPHLNSFLQQNDGGWESFHARHIGEITTALDRLLPQNYYVTTEKSLQISEIGLDVIQRKRTRPDVSVYQMPKPAAQPFISAAMPTPTLTMPLEETLGDEDDYLNAMTIYQLVEGKFPGKLVTRLEVLSPSNKYPKDYYPQYLTKRVESISSGVCLVEVDYIHEQRPLITALPSYPNRETGAFPYMVIVSDPQPRPPQGHVDIYGFGINDALPLVAIPLGAVETLALDFNELYHKTFEGMRIFSMLTDYEQLPVNFDRYTAADQVLIQARMAEIAGKSN